nr:MAG TPA: hypothetical protein [Caudoviricetes sp.]
MERLTKKSYLGTDHYMKCSENCNMDMDCIDCPLFARLVERLAAYEEEVTAMQNTLDEYHKVADPLLRAQADGRVMVLSSDKALTNADRMRVATNQQLAKLLYDSQKEFCRLMYKNLGFEDELEFSEDYSDILAWLNTSVETEKALKVMKDG